MGAPAKSAPATSQPGTNPAPGAAGALAGPPPVKPLQPAKKIQIKEEERPTKGGGGVAAAAAALEKPKEKVSVQGMVKKERLGRGAQWDRMLTKDCRKSGSAR